jgi:Fe-S-cluster containining protein
VTAGCARCGSCCDPVIIETDIVLRCAWQARSQERPSANALFITQHWHPIEAWRDLKDGVSVTSARCDMFDPATRLCTAHESRPPICSRFPWYGDQPGADRAAPLPRHCSFLADVPPDQRPSGARPLLPLAMGAT